MARGVFSGLTTFLLSFVALCHWSSTTQEAHRKEVYGWLNDVGLSPHRSAIYESGCWTAVRCAALASHPSPSASSAEGDLWVGVPAEVRASFRHAGLRLRSRLLLRRWLHERSRITPQHEQQVLERVDSLQELVQLASNGLEGHEGRQSDAGDLPREVVADAAALPRDPEDLRAITEGLWNQLAADDWEPWSTGDLAVLLVCGLLVAAMTTGLAPRGLLIDRSSAAAASKLSFLSYLTGKYLSPNHCKVEFDWAEPLVAGSTVTFFIKFFQRNGRAYPICNEDPLLVEVLAGGGAHKVACSVELGGADPSHANRARVQFTVRRAGPCVVSVLLDAAHVRGSPFRKTFLPDRPDPQKTGFIHHCSTVVCTQSVPHHLFIEPRDKYNNPCIVERGVDPSDDYAVDIVEVSSNRPVPSCFQWGCHPETSRIALVLDLNKEGCYEASVSYRGTVLSNGAFHVIVLNRSDAALVQKNVAKKSHYTWYEAKLIAWNCEKVHKPKRVFVYISPKQLTIKEYMLKIIPVRLVTFRLCPSTKFQFKGNNNQVGEPVLVIDDGCQPQVEMISEERNIIAATFTQYLLKNIGGSETFKDKQEFFYHEVRKLHQKHFHDKLQIKVTRDKILETSVRATKNLSSSDWCKNFEITFLGEQGIDWGGLRREWFELVCCALFDPENQLFHRFKNDKQGLVHPNPRRPSYLKLKHYEYAGRIVGKCLYESALGSSYRQLVKARFSRSFLAQLIGLRVHYKYFEQDDPDLYVSKIKYILENDVEDMELYFSEEEYTDSGKLLRTTELIPGGSRIRVDNGNKLQYLDALAQYRLANSVKEEVEYFLKGLNELIPDNLLCIFDENELELLMCGTGQYSIADFKANHSVSGFLFEQRKVLDWFWTAVSNFTEEEMARLLQFTTGCSQLPPGGFAELNPKFHITTTPTFGNLPTAHTCFNQLCLPDYDSYEQFERALRLSINEGMEGFGMI